MHQVIDLKILYSGTPVVLISTRNPDGTANLAPMSSAWWLGDHCMLGMNAGSQTTRNLMRERECVLNLPSADLAGAVDRLALLTGSAEITPHKSEMGCQYEPDKFGAAGLTAHTVRVSRAHVREQLIVPGTRHIDPLAWQPLIMKFCEFFGDGTQLRPSRLAQAWEIPQPTAARPA